MIDSPRQIKDQVRRFSDTDWEEVTTITFAFMMAYKMDPFYAQACAIVRLAEDRLAGPRLIH